MSNRRKFVFVVLLLIAFAALTFIVYRVVGLIIDKQSNESLRDVAFETTAPTTSVVTAPTTTGPNGETEETKPTYEVVYDSPINFVDLCAINMDIYAWIEIDDTPISYPVLQNTDDYLYYLNHTYDGNYNTNGSIFSESYSSHEFEDHVTVLYGHNLLNDEMFGSLSEYRNQTYFDEHRTIKIYTYTQSLEYTVFAAVVYTDELISNKYDLSTDEGVTAFLEEIDGLRNMNNIIMDDVEVTCDSHVLVLSTCTGNSSQRYLVLAVLNEDDA